MQVEAEVDVLVQLVLGVEARLVANRSPGGCSDRHVAPKEQMELARHLDERTTQGVVGLVTKPAEGHVVVDDRAGAGRNLGVLERLLDGLDPRGLKHGVRVDATNDLARGVVESKVARRDQPLQRVLLQVDDRGLGEGGLERVHNRGGAVGRLVVDDDDLVGGERLVKGGEHTSPNCLFLVVGGNNDRDARQRHAANLPWMPAEAP